MNDNNLDKVCDKFLIMSKISSNFKSFNISFSTDINKKASKRSLDNEARRRFLIIFNLLNTRSQLTYIFSIYTFFFITVARGPLCCRIVAQWPSPALVGTDRRCQIPTK